MEKLHRRLALFLSFPLVDLWYVLGLFFLPSPLTWEFRECRGAFSYWLSLTCSRGQLLRLSPEDQLPMQESFRLALITLNPTSSSSLCASASLASSPTWFWKSSCSSSLVGILELVDLESSSTSRSSSRRSGRSAWSSCSNSSSMVSRG